MHRGRPSSLAPGVGRNYLQKDFYMTDPNGKAISEKEDLNPKEGLPTPGVKNKCGNKPGEKKPWWCLSYGVISTLIALLLAWNAITAQPRLTDCFSEHDSCETMAAKEVLLRTLTLNVTNVIVRETKLVEKIHTQLVTVIVTATYTPTPYIYRNCTIETYIIYRQSNQCRLSPKGLNERLSSAKLLQGASRFIGELAEILGAKISHAVSLPIPP